MASHRILTCEIIYYDNTVGAGADPNRSFKMGSEGRDLWNLVEDACMAGRIGGEGSQMGITVRSLGVNLPQATTSFTVTRASFTAGDILRVVIPGADFYNLTAVASNADPTKGQYSNGAATDTDFALSIKAAVNMSPLRQWVTCTNSTNTLTFTSVRDNAECNNYKLYKLVTTAGVFSFANGVAFTGALKTLSSSSAVTVTLGGLPSINDTLVIGPVTLTWVTSAANENQVTIGGTTTIAATNLKNAILAHSVLRNYVTASSSVNIATITSVLASITVATWTVTKTGTYTPVISGSLYPATAVIQGADQVRSYNIR